MTLLAFVLVVSVPAFFVGLAAIYLFRAITAWRDRSLNGVYTVRGLAPRQPVPQERRW